MHTSHSQTSRSYSLPSPSPSPVKVREAPPASSSSLSLSAPHQPPFYIYPLALALSAIINNKFGTRNSHETCVTRCSRFISGSRPELHAECLDALMLYSKKLSRFRFRVQREP